MTLENYDQLSPAEKEKVMTAIEQLLIKNPKLPDQLTKLAEVKTTKPFIWNMALKKLGV